MNHLDKLPTLSLLDGRLPLITRAVEVVGRMWQITSVQSPEELLDTAEEWEHFPYGLLLWESAIGLSRHIAARPALAAGKRILEIGTGVGLAGIVARECGAEVSQTDHHKAALILAGQNARQNGVSGIKTFLADWRTWQDNSQYDLILGSDVIYERSMYFYLESIFNRNLKPDGSLLISDPGRPQALEFMALLEKSGWNISMETQSVSLPDGGSQGRVVDVEIYSVSLD